MANIIVNPKTKGNPIVLGQSLSETWITNGVSITIKQAILEDVSADTTSACIFAKDASSATLSNLAHRDARSGINTVIWSEPVTFSRLYLRALNAGRVILTLE